MSRDVGSFLTRHKNMLMVTLLAVTLICGSAAGRDVPEHSQTAVTLPVMQTDTAALSALEQFRQAREEAMLADMAALQALCDQEKLDDQTRQDAADRLQRIVEQHQAQLAIESALLTSSLAPCTAVVRTGSVTIVTDRADVTQEESALVIAVAKEYAGVSAPGVQVITAQ